MTTKQVLSLACMFLGKEELLECEYFTKTTDYNLTESEEKELDYLKRCLYLITNEISTDYLPIYAEKAVDFLNGELALGSIDSNIYEIVKITDKNGKNIRFKIYDNIIYANVDKAIIKYTKFAKEVDLNGDCEDFSGKIPDRVLAYGVAMEYSFVCSLFDDATIWENRYKNALLVLANKKQNIIMPKRRWV